METDEISDESSDYMLSFVTIPVIGDATVVLSSVDVIGGFLLPKYRSFHSEKASTQLFVYTIIMVDKEDLTLPEAFVLVKSP